jgi:hypothetical protein
MNLLCDCVMIFRLVNFSFLRLLSVLHNIPAVVIVKSDHTELRLSASNQPHKKNPVGSIKCQPSMVVIHQRLLIVVKQTFRI